jgi:hypothetical protein
MTWNPNWLREYIAQHGTDSVGVSIKKPSLQELGWPVSMTGYSFEASICIKSPQSLPWRANDHTGNIQQRANARREAARSLCNLQAPRKRSTGTSRLAMKELLTRNAQDAKNLKENYMATTFKTPLIDMQPLNDGWDDLNPYMDEERQLALIENPNEEEKKALLRVRETLRQMTGTYS